MHRRNNASWRASETCIASRCNSHSVVLPTISVNRNVTVPTGNGVVGEAGTGEVICRNRDNRNQNRGASTLAEESAALGLAIARVPTRHTPYKSPYAATTKARTVLRSQRRCVERTNPYPR